MNRRTFLAAAVAMFVPPEDGVAFDEIERTANRYWNARPEAGITAREIHEHMRRLWPMLPVSGRLP